jgi:hypothetical protein
MFLGNPNNLIRGEPMYKHKKDDVNNCKLEVPDECKNSCNCCIEKQKCVEFNPCEDIKYVEIQNVNLQCTGRFLSLKIQLCDVRGGSNMAVGVMIFDDSGILGYRVCRIKVPGPKGECIKHVHVGEFCFAIPEEMPCSKRTVNVKVIAHCA